MEASGPRPGEPEVPLADAGIAASIAHAAARGRGSDRAPTLEQLLAAFGEREPTDAARRRVAAALRVANLGVRPGLHEAQPGQRLLLTPAGGAARRPQGRALMGLLALAGVLVLAVAAAALLGQNGGGSASDDLPAGAAGTTAAATATAPGAVPTTPTGATTSVPATDTTPADTTASVPAAAPDATTTATAPAAAQRAAVRRRAAAARRARERRRRQAAARRRAAAARRTVTVRLDATAAPTFLCVDDGAGHQLFAGTLNGRRVFKSRRIRLNVGNGFTKVTVNGHAVRLTGSPAGLDITRKGGARELASGQRPCG